MAYNFFAYIFRTRYIARWALMRNTRTENVEEHSYEVAVLAHALAAIGREICHKDVDPAYNAENKHQAQLAPVYEPLIRESDESVRPYVKAADKLAAWLKCLEEQKAGNTEFNRAADETLAALRAMGMEEVDWFLAELAGAFQLTLDDLG